ncbi:hypothetical protein P3T35_002449 [Kitasatospora sp. GP30]|uniref:glycoside hydrolase family 55 protein n=1 Tax=Kitasatospora sp. GP30 TaxID=3035084 RepID=UPI000CC0ADF5|nr:glycoside hydrolase family 55 protein [Kitasatospora sp. GP30]MDH6140441.1 hypothetical protein [Kitasatospora sp. GP30]
MSSNPSRRTALRLAAAGGGALAAAAPGGSAAAAPAVHATPPTVFDVAAYGAVGDGTTDDTAAIQSALNAAGKTPGSLVNFPPAAGGCYRTSGLAVPGGVAVLQGQSCLSAANAPTTAALTGSVLAPLTASTSTLLAIGSSGNGAAVATNPHGLIIDGLGFLGTTPAGSGITGFWAASVVDTSDVTFRNCRDLYCDPPGFKGYPTGGKGNGGFVRFLSSGTGNFFSVNGRLLFCSSYGAGTFLLADGLSAAYPGGGSTDGQVMGCQVNGHNHGAQFGPLLAGAGGWIVLESHFSSAEGTNHISYGLAGHPWTLRLDGCYFDLIRALPVDCHGRGLQAIGNYFRALSNSTAIAFGPGLATSGSDPAAVLTGNILDLNGATTVASFARFDGFTAADFPTKAGGQYSGNVVHNHGAAMPKSWVGQFVDSKAAVIPGTSSARLQLQEGPVLSA